MSNYYETTHTPLDQIREQQGLTDEQRAALLGEGCMYVEGRILEMLDGLKNNSYRRVSQN